MEETKKKKWNEAWEDGINEQKSRMAYGTVDKVC